MLSKKEELRLRKKIDSISDKGFLLGTKLNRGAITIAKIVVSAIALITIGGLSFLSGIGFGLSRRGRRNLYC